MTGALATYRDLRVCIRDDLPKKGLRLPPSVVSRCRLDDENARRAAARLMFERFRYHWPELPAGIADQAARRRTPIASYGAAGTPTPVFYQSKD
jgi:hypothetical protein